MYKIKNVSIFIFLAFTNIISGAQASHAISIPKAVKINNLGVKGDLFPPIIKKLIDEFNHIDKEGIEQPPFANRIILHGPHGTGKTTIAKYFAQETDSYFIYVSGAALLNTYQNSGATTIKKIFAYIKEQAENSFEKFVILIDEADKMASSHAKDNLKVAMDSTVSEFWQGLDSIDNCDNVKVFLTTNHLNKITSTGLLERIESSHIIYVPGLDDNQRKEYIRNLFITLQIPHLRLARLIKYVSHLEQNNRTIKETLNSHLEGIQETCHKLRIQFNSYVVSGKVTSELEKVTILLATLQKQHDELMRLAQSNPTAKEPATWKLITGYLYLIKQYIQRLQEHKNKAHIHLSQGQLNRFANETKEFSIRRIIELMYSIHYDASINNNGVFKDDGIYWEKLAQLKAKINLAEKETKNNELREKQRELQEDVAFKNAVRQYHSEPYYVPVNSVSVQGGVSVGMASGIPFLGSTKVSGNLGVNAAHQMRDNKQIPTVEETHELAKTAKDPLKKSASALILERDTLHKLSNDNR